MLKIQNGCKRYKGQEVLKDINLEFLDGHIYGLVGINGSGKTLILKALAGYITLDRGFVQQDHIKIRSRRNYIENAGILIENPQFISHLSLLENLELIASISQNRKKIDLDRWIQLYQLEKFKHTLFKHLSLGTKKKMALIQAFLHNPAILLLDEPMNALDDASVRVTKELLMEYKQDRLVILTSHIAQDIEDLCDTVYTVSDGQIVC
ncbi:ATP-binding cassette domain-containing protein [Streptococcus himalayensis]|uniref:ABC transporter ATP-binding protein n=1 Tax=Streptococcus himalayensis TaxID=1888195 RepID=A0A917A8B2_9STRE|nr:ABC transporter ATP-binding protein [Streptococcus himalayensis]GGE32398.1 ABC transporter ATP-binding protein [Streptococcus himalayensis]